ncbi:MAG TPA: AI-2E family transporter [Saprospiraceae bacterium]|nr:AI-2E family transporter [Saprospiraceae bacterium]
MASTDIKSPIYLKLSVITMGLVAFLFLLYVGKDILVPLIFSTIIAILLNPMVMLLVRKKINRTIAIALSVLSAYILIAILAYFIFSQAALFSEALPDFKAKFLAMFNELISWFSANLNVSVPKINAWIEKTKAEGMDNSSAAIGSALTTAGGFLVLFFLLPVYIFLILFYKALFLEFISMLFARGQKTVVDEVLKESKTLIQSYLIGLLLETGIVAVLNSIGLLVLGIEYAILIGVIGALLNLIPYIGGLVAISIPMLMAIATKEPIDALWVFALYMIVQLFDNNFIVPKIVGSRVKINALVSIVVVLIGGAMWGVAGMFLSIPLTAIVKVICDRITQLKPFGFLLGDNHSENDKVEASITLQNDTKLS